MFMHILANETTRYPPGFFLQGHDEVCVFSKTSYKTETKGTVLLKEVGHKCSAALSQSGSDGHRLLFSYFLFFL